MTKAPVRIAHMVWDVYVNIWEGIRSAYAEHPILCWMVLYYAIYLPVILR